MLFVELSLFTVSALNYKGNDSLSNNDGSSSKNF